MESSLVKFCDLIADEGAKYAHQHKQLFLEIMEETTGRSISKKEADLIFMIFSFLNWTYANGVWSNLSNTTLRRDLMGQTMTSIVARTALDLAKDKSVDGVASLAAGLDELFKKLTAACFDRVKELSRQGLESDANAATLYGLEWIQKTLYINEEHMSVIVPQFINRVGNVAKIEETAKQVNQAALESKKGFFSRVFGS
jgi:hypothetical protein